MGMRMRMRMMGKRMRRGRESEGMGEGFRIGSNLVSMDVFIVVLLMGR